MLASLPSAAPIERATICALLFDRLALRLFVAFAFPFGSSAMLGGLRFQASVLDRRLLKDQHGLGHFADFVVVGGIGDRDRPIALGQGVHGAGQRHDRPLDAAGDQEREAETDRQTRKS